MMSWEDLSAAERAKAIGYELASGIPFGGEWIDEAAGAIYGPQAAERIRGYRGAFEQAHPWAAFGTQFLGGILSALPLAALGPGGGAVAAGAKAAKAGRALGLLRAAAAGAGLGAIEGAVSGAGAGETPDERWRKAREWAAFGGAFGGAVGGGGHLAASALHGGAGIGPLRGKVAMSMQERSGAAGGRAASVPKVAPEYRDFVSRKVGEAGGHELNLDAATLEWMRRHGMGYPPHEQLMRVEDAAWLEWMRKHGIEVPDPKDAHQQAAVRIVRMLWEGRPQEVDPYDLTAAWSGPDKGAYLRDLYDRGLTGMDLPMDEASRMERARQMGFTDRAYHGTGFSFLRPDRSHLGGMTKAKSARAGLFASSEPEVAGVYARSATYKQGEKAAADIYNSYEWPLSDSFNAGADQFWDEIGPLVAKQFDDMREAIEKRGLPPATADTVEQVTSAIHYRLADLPRELLKDVRNGNIPSSLDGRDLLVGEIAAAIQFHGPSSGSKNLGPHSAVKMAEEIVDELDAQGLLDDWRHAVKEAKFVADAINEVRRQSSRAAQEVRRAKPGERFEVKMPPEMERARPTGEDLPRAEIIPLLVRTDKMHTLEHLRGKSWHDIAGTYGDTINEAFKRTGADVLKVPEFIDPAPPSDHYVIRNLAAIRRPEAAFDPRLKDLAHLMAGLSALTVGPGILGAAGGGIPRTEEPLY